jgi:hypothetical protein
MRKSNRDAPKAYKRDGSRDLKRSAGRERGNNYFLEIDPHPRQRTRRRDR